MLTDPPPRWPFRVVVALALASGALFGAGGAWAAVWRSGWFPLGRAVRCSAIGAVCGVFAAALWCLAMMPGRRRGRRPLGREEPWLFFWGVFWGYVAWALAGMAFHVWVHLAYGVPAREDDILADSLLASGALGLVAGTLGGLLALAAERVAWHLASTRAASGAAPIDTARRARSVRRHRLLLLAGLAAVVGLGVVGALTVPTKSLDEALMEGDIAEVRKHLLWARDANMPDVNGETALYRSIAYGEGQVARMLIGRGLDVNAASRAACCLSMAAVIGDRELTRLLITKGADVNGPRPAMLLPPLHTAVRFCSVPIVRALLDADADCNLLNSGGQSPLAVATMLRAEQRRRLAPATDPVAEGEADDGPADWLDPAERREILDRLARTEQIIKLLEKHGAKVIGVATQPGSHPSNGSAGP